MFIGNISTTSSLDDKVQLPREQKTEVQNLVKENSTSKKKTQNQVEKEVRTYFEDIPVMAEIARCESRFRHTNPDGSILRGEAIAEDVGVMQINELYHLDESKKLGFDIYDLKGNLAYGRHLYETKGTQPWSASKSCWSNSTTLAKK